ncbi:hypothetical protein ACFZBU_12615 [Embleya sp. NPDC008237]|uniref:hypothetical protein n=1 Tax=unclassified Embleya TaxID=2699296 RepID=UPI0036E35BBC
MEIHHAKGHLTIPGHDTEVEVALDLFDWPIDGEILPRTWSAIIDNGPVLDVGTEGALRLSTEPATVAHPFVVTASGYHVIRINGRETPRAGGRPF